MRKVVVLDGALNISIEDMFKARGFEVVEDVEDADLLVFTGGEDVSPHLYGEHQHPTTYSNVVRDTEEEAKYKYALELGLPMVGICRGGQFLNVMNGGTLWQDVDNHAIGGTHKAYVIGGLTAVEVSSTHHQMMRPNYGNITVQVLATAAETTYKEHMSATPLIATIERFDIAKSRTSDTEVVYYGDSNCLCFQPHPEFSGEQYKPCQDLFFTMLEQYCFGENDDDDIPF